MNTLDNNNVIDLTKSGTIWPAEAIKEELQEIISCTSLNHHEFYWDNDDKLNYLYDNQCYLFIEDSIVVVRCDRETIHSEATAAQYKIKNISDIIDAYKLFISMTIE